MRHPSKVGAFCARKMYQRMRGKCNANVLGHGGPPRPTKLRRRGKPQVHPSSQMGMPFWGRLRMRARRDALVRERKAKKP